MIPFFGEEFTVQKVNVVCMKWGEKYTPEYVNALYGMVKRNLTLPHRFVCLTENPHGIRSEVEIKPLPDFDEPGPKYLRYCLAWRKIAVFEKKLYDLNGKILFLDLDVVIIDNIDCFFGFSEKLGIIENWSQKGRLIGQASAFCFESGKYGHLLEKYKKNPEAVLQHKTEQVYITRELGRDGFDFFPDDWCKSFKFHCLPGGILNGFIAPTKVPENAKIIVFHGNPKPDEAFSGIWGGYVPWYKRFYKTLKPARWIADYWYP